MRARHFLFFILFTSENDDCTLEIENSRDRSIDRTVDYVDHLEFEPSENSRNEFYAILPKSVDGRDSRRR